MSLESNHGTKILGNDFRPVKSIYERKGISKHHGEGKEMETCKS